MIRRATILLCIAVLCNSFLGVNARKGTRFTQSAPPVSTTRLSVFSNVVAVASKAVTAIKASPTTVIISVASVVLGSVLPTLIQGVTYGESLYSVIAPLLSKVEAFLKGIPFIEGLLRKYIFQKGLIFEGVQLPLEYSESISTFLTLTGTSQFAIVKFLAASVGDILSIGGMNKSDPKSFAKFEEFHQDYVNYAIKPRGPFDISNTLPDDYLYFGNGKNLENAPYFFKTNPYFTASLRSNDGSTFVVDPFGKFGRTYMTEIVSCLDSAVPLVEATFDSHMNLIDMKVYNKTNPDVVIQGYSKERAATALLYQCSYYAQNIHATTHVSSSLLTTHLLF